VIALFPSGYRRAAAVGRLLILEAPRRPVGRPRRPPQATTALLLFATRATLFFCQDTAAHSASVAAAAAPPALPVGTSVIAG
jgi:hypothetical protein